MYSQIQCFCSKVVVSTVSILTTLTSIDLLAAGNARLFGVGGLVKVSALVPPAFRLTAKLNSRHNYFRKLTWRWGSYVPSFAVVSPN